MKIMRKQKYEEKQLYGQTSDISHKKNVNMAKKGKP